ncbi:nucleotide-binding protein [Symbioplanes lichenis]|uniref:nucleotide-binding protein n=1 Tax=Symbioplanes lichenis TaxID=1629072 RepID=UPI00273930A2|nr:nucleotide-binding protein [Actinoplanes lichenis]
MRIFIGSSSESSSLMRKIALWVENAGHEPLRWQDPGVFPPGSYTLQALQSVVQRVDAAIFIFGEDDQVWYRSDQTSQPRDNVLAEWGLFTGALGEGRVIICRTGRPKTASDLHGITYVQMDQTSMVHAEEEVDRWLANLELMGPGKGWLKPMSPFQARGKPALFERGTALLRGARRHVALVAKTPILLVGCRPYDRSTPPYEYESVQFDLYAQMAHYSASGTVPRLICVASRPAMLQEVEDHRQDGLDVRVRENLRGLHTAMAPGKSKLDLRWYDGTESMTFLVCDDDFIIWTKDSSGESVWITAHNASVARALYYQASLIGTDIAVDAFDTGTGV